MRSPVPTIANNVPDQITQADDMIRSMKDALPYQQESGAKNAVQLLLNRIDELELQIASHDAYSAGLVMKIRKDADDYRGAARHLLAVHDGREKPSAWAISHARKILEEECLPQ